MILIEIMLQIVIAKLKDNSAMEHDRQHWKAAKALVIVIPLLGITYLFTLMGPGEEWPVFYIVFQIIRAILLSSQVRIKGGINFCNFCKLNFSNIFANLIYLKICF